MSWQTYVDSNLVGTNNVKYAAICGLDGNVWAKSDTWNVTQPEVSSIIKNFEDSSSLAMSGLTLAGEKFFYLSGAEGIVRGKKGRNGVHIAKTKTAVIIAMYAEPTQPSQCALVVESLADYLRDQAPALATCEHGNHQECCEYRSRDRDTAWWPHPPRRAEKVCPPLHEWGWIYSLHPWRLHRKQAEDIAIFL